ncbi:MAG: hypothetical protein D6E12_06030 [Desulfovibrio sp.]|nr:MAG: hypothetical protein D6E12_06030 [Desulfovibrio sp.]
MKSRWLVLCCIFIVSCVVASCGDASPVEVVESFYEQVQGLDPESADQAQQQAAELVDDMFRVSGDERELAVELVAFMAQLAPLVEYRDMAYSLESGGGDAEDTAMVRVTGVVVMESAGVVGSEPLDATYPLVRGEGGWRITLGLENLDLGGEGETE